MMKHFKWRASVALRSLGNSVSGLVLPQFDIVITTYIGRFETYLKPSLYKLSKLFPNHSIVCIVNDYHDTKLQEQYAMALEEYSRKFSNVNLVFCKGISGLARMWNIGIATCTGQHMLILNDDLDFLPRFRTSIANSEILKSNIGTINGSWSHFLISRSLFNLIGSFDENFTGFGYEDDDYLIRLAIAGVQVEDFEFLDILHLADEGLYMASFEKTSRISGNKYSSLNKVAFFDKWIFSETMQPGFIFVPRLGNWAQKRN